MLQAAKQRSLNYYPATMGADTSLASVNFVRQTQVIDATATVYQMNIQISTLRIGRWKTPVPPSETAFQRKPSLRHCRVFYTLLLQECWCRLARRKSHRPVRTWLHNYAALCTTIQRHIGSFICLGPGRGAHSHPYSKQRSASRRGTSRTRGTQVVDRNQAALEKSSTNPRRRWWWK